jgi:outer membrane biosynthesis protein TonB
MLKMIFGTFALIALLTQTPAAAVAQATPTPSPDATTTPVPTSTPSARPRPTATPTPLPSATPLPVPTVTAPPPATPLPPLPTPWPTPTPMTTPAPLPSPVPTVTPLPTPLVLPPDAPPQILAVQLSDPVFHGGETITGTIITSTNVAAVEIRLAGHSMRMPRTDFGIWSMTYKMPHVPFFYRGRYTAQIVAMNSAGAQAEQDLTVSVR